jgi:hypothetical protein
MSIKSKNKSLLRQKFKEELLENKLDDSDTEFYENVLYNIESNQKSKENTTNVYGQKNEYYQDNFIIAKTPEKEISILPNQKNSEKVKKQRKISQRKNISVKNSLAFHNINSSLKNACLSKDPSLNREKEKNNLRQKILQSKILTLVPKTNSIKNKKDPQDDIWKYVEGLSKTSLHNFIKEINECIIKRLFGKI